MNSMLLGIIEKIPVEKMIESISADDVRKALNKLEYKGKFIPVSYTHLDVYKRQACDYIGTGTFKSITDY